MLTAIKEQFYNLLKSLGYKVTDNGTYKEDFPWLMLTTGNYQSSVSLDIKYDIITLKLDIFSTYNGEKEIIQISENIVNHLQDLRRNNPDITAITQKKMTIIGDKETGPVRKHGILTYQFLVTSGLDLEDNNDDTTGD